MTSTLKIALLSFAAAVASGCATKFNGPEHALSVDEEHPISVDSQTVTMTLASSGTLTSIDRARLRAFADAYLRDGHGALTLTSPSTDAGARATDIQKALGEFGVPADAVVTSNYRTGEGSTTDLILSYAHYVATPSACGVWEGMQDRDFRNMRSPNFGCSARNNLAAMIGDPHDLIAPAAMTAPDAQIRVRGVQLFRQGQVTSSDTDGDIEQTVAN
ncbi:MAG: CpaD family pilus assembly protein [Parvularculaceae bacterium]|nr:CpaD family pilus assembly protein [Parvularculaceae bacterium]